MGIYLLQLTITITLHVAISISFVFLLFFIFLINILLSPHIINAKLFLYIHHLWQMFFMFHIYGCICIMYLIYTLCIEGGWHIVYIWLVCCDKYVLFAYKNNMFELVSLQKKKKYILWHAKSLRKVQKSIEISTLEEWTVLRSFVE